MPSETMTKSEIYLAEAKAAQDAAEAAVKAAAEAAARVPKAKIVTLCPLPTGMMALMDDGRLFFRELDNRNFDGRNPMKYVWRQVEGPLD